MDISERLQDDIKGDTKERLKKMKHINSHFKIRPLRTDHSVNGLTHSTSAPNVSHTFQSNVDLLLYRNYPN